MAQLATEADIRRYAEGLYATAAAAPPRLFDRAWWTGRLLEWAIRDEAFKVQLFRFIDVLPALKNPAQIKALVEEYFGESGLPAAGSRSLMRWGMRALSAVGFGASISADTIYNQTLQMANQFIAGAGMSDALLAVGELWKRGLAHSVDLLGEAVVSEREADAYAARYEEAITSLANAAAGWPSAPSLEADHLGRLPRAQVSIKLSALYSQFDPIDPDGCYTAIAARLRPLLRLAARLPVGITFDMEQYAGKNLTIGIVRRLLLEDEFRAYPYASIALQAYLRDTERDVKEFIAWAKSRRQPFGIRLVKGAYWDYETIIHRQRGWPIPVFAEKDETDACYERLIPIMLDEIDVIRPMWGTHNLRQVAFAIAEAARRQLPTNSIEIQMLHGMADALQDAVVKAGYRLRVYAPVGELLAGMAYLVRRLLENTANESILRRQFMGSQSLDELVRPPFEGQPDTVRHVPEQAQGKREDHRPPVRPEALAGNGRFVNVPHTDFALAPARDRMQEALAVVKRRLGRRIDLALAPQAGNVRPALISRNPARPEEVVGIVTAAGPEVVDEAVVRAQASGRSWLATPAKERIMIVQRAADLLGDRRFEVAALEVYEAGKTWREADADVAEAIDFLNYYAGEMRRLGAPIRLGEEPGELNQLLYRPRGIAAVLSPWNFPLAIPAGMVSGALVTGNTVLFKPSERAPMTAYVLVEIFREAGLPDGVLQFLPGEAEVGRRLVAHPEISIIAFTGSKAVGLEIIAEAARLRPGQRDVKKVIAEMGGKNAIIIDETADLDEAVAGVTASFLGYQGQKCSACSRLIMVDAIHDGFVQRLVEAARSVHMGMPEDPGTALGPLIDERAVRKVMEYIEIGEKEGRAVLRPDLAHRPGPNFIGPAVFTEIRPEHRLAKEEIFGPVLAVLRARDYEDALAIANATEYALTGGLYSRSPRNIARARDAFCVGNLYINRGITGAMVGRQPFGGARLSGMGAKAGGPDYLVQFMSASVISEQTLRRGFSPDIQPAGMNPGPL
jgi:RHH-type proline utilization regulon transcriptional repressor/proline dehydrogenase/delta 1-pyrroline-5-carboxylate dehydrogenase